jgi:hypothetical protein
VKQSNVENPPIMDVTKRTTIETTTKESAITITTTRESLKTEILTTERIKITTTSEPLKTKILTTEMIKITASRGILLLNCFQNYLLFNLKYFIHIMI